MFLLYTYTDVFFISPAVAASIFLYTRFWDAINDPIMGVIVDKRPFAKKGKGVYRPWLLISIPFLVITFGCCFTMPNFITSDTGKIMWAVAFYILYTMAQTLGQVPFGSMSNALTTNIQERGLLGSYRNFGENIASFLVSLVMMSLVSFFASKGGNGYAGAAWVLAIAAAICIFICYKNTKERAVVEESKEETAKVGFKESFKMLLHNRPTLCMIFGLFVAAVVINFRFAYVMYYANVYLADVENIATTINSVQTFVAIFYFWIVNWMFKHINDVPKYGNDNDYADGWVATAQNIWYDAIDEANKNRDNFPEYGGYFRGGSCLGNTAVTAGLAVCALPDGFNKSHPMADAMSPTQGRDVNGTSAVQKSMSKLPSERFEMGTLLNQRLTPQMLATEEDVWRFVDYLRAFEALGNFHVQFNVIDCDTLHKAMEKPEEYKDLLVRVASYVSYFIELGEPDQLDIIHRTEQNEW